MVTLQPISVFTLMTMTYTGALLKDESSLERRKCSAYIGSSPWRFDLYGGSLEKWKRSWWSLYGLYRVFTLTTTTHTEGLLKDRSALDGHSTAYIRSSPWQLRHMRRLSWKTEEFLIVTLQPILGLYLNNYDLYEGSSERRKRSWWSLYSLYRVPTLMAKTYIGQNIGFTILGLKLSRQPVPTVLATNITCLQIQANLQVAKHKHRTSQGQSTLWNGSRADNPKKHDEPCLTFVADWAGLHGDSR